MPRVKSDTTVTHRIEFSPVERNLLAEAMLEHRKSIPFKRAKEISSSFGGFAAPVAGAFTEDKAGAFASLASWYQFDLFVWVSAKHFDDFFVDALI